MSNYAVWIIEDEKPIAELLQYGLQQEGYRVRTAFSGSDGLKLFENDRPDLLILDWMLPDCSGVDLCQMITKKYNVPIIMLTARSSMDDKVHGLEAGADDYITKPFELREVIVRIKVILRRIGKSRDAGSGPLSFHGMLLQPEERIVERDGQPIDLTPREYDLLLFLLRRPHQVFTRDVLLEQVWGYDYLGDTRTVDTHIQRLRKKLDMADSIQTVFGVGYKYTAE